MISNVNRLSLAVGMVIATLVGQAAAAPVAPSENVTINLIRLLVQGQEAVVRTARGIFPLLDKVSDEPTADLLTQRMQTHEKTAWMLRSLLAA